MKTFKEYLKSNKKEEGSGVIPEPIHFKFVDMIKPLTKAIPDPIHFKHVSSTKRKKLDEGKSINPTKAWLKTNDNEHLGKTPSAISKKLNADNNFEDHHHGAITSYTGGNDHKGKSDAPNESWHSHQINRALIKGKSVPKKHQKTSNDLDDAIKKNPIKKEVSTYSGVTFDPRKLKDEKGRIKSPAYISTTHDKNVAHNFAVNQTKGRNPIHIMHFHLKPGDNASHISGASEFSGEHETVIGKGQTLQHHGTDSHWDNDHEHWVHIHHVSIAKD